MTSWGTARWWLLSYSPVAYMSACPDVCTCVSVSACAPAFASRTADSGPHMLLPPPPPPLPRGGRKIRHEANFSSASQAASARHTRQKRMWSSIHKKISPLSHLPPQPPHTPFLHPPAPLFFISPPLLSLSFIHPCTHKTRTRAHPVNDCKRPGKVTSTSITA